jgi:AcrR family transcriptional regulator
MPSISRKRKPTPTRRPVTRGIRLGGRSGRVVVDVLSAAAAELAARGYAAFRVDGVASAAGVNKTTVYRRWPTKAHLVEAALRDVLSQSRERPDTGSVSKDLLTMLEREVRWHQTPQGASILRIVHLEAGEPDVRRIVEVLRAETLRPWIAVIEQGKARGEIGRTIDSRLLVEMILVPTMMRLHRLHEPVDRATLAQIVRLVVFGARPEKKGPRRS